MLGALTDQSAKPYLLAGGTDLIVRLRRGHVRPTLVIDTKGVRDLHNEIVSIDGGLRIGARVTMTSIVGDPRVREHFHALVEAASVVGSVQIRNRATLAGNICNASPAADTAPALLVYGAVVNVLGSAGARRVPVAEFFTGPGTTVLAPDEIVASIDLPVPDGPVGAAFGRLTRRRGVDLATLNVCCLVNPSGAARIALGAVAPRPLLVQEDSDAAMVDRVVAHASPISDVRASREYRAAMLPVFIRRTLQIAADRLQRAQPHA
jgi:CO/xanthine dehydrogenase FAD-binding subunit